MRRLIVLIALVLTVASAAAAELNQKLADELNAMRDADQKLLKRQIDEPDNAELRAEIDALLAKHTARLREIIREVGGWPGKSLVGVRAGGAAWIIAQHGGPEIIDETLPLMKAAAEAGEIEWGLVATTIDRQLVQKGKKQIYGTQFKDGNPEPIEDPEHVDERRAKIGMAPLAEYTRLLREAYKIKPKQ